MGEFETVIHVGFLISLGFSCFNKFVKLEFKEGSTEFATLVSEFFSSIGSRTEGAVF